MIEFTIDPNILEIEENFRGEAGQGLLDGIGLDLQQEGIGMSEETRATDMAATTTQESWIKEEMRGLVHLCECKENQLKSVLNLIWLKNNQISNHQVFYLNFMVTKQTVARYSSLSSQKTLHCQMAKNGASSSLSMMRLQIVDQCFWTENLPFCLVRIKKL